ncbi:MAG: hypothetical protein ABSF80_04560 [Chitinispirillaceae bacterium]|jgi:hypothetical protein
MNEKWIKLHETINQIIELLVFYRIEIWPNELKEINKKISNQLKESPKLFLNLYGGMGSLTDINICTQNNNIIKEKDVEAVNNKLKNLISQAFDLTEQIQKNLTIMN